MRVLVLAILVMITAACTQETDTCGNAARIEGTEASDQLVGESVNECLLGFGGNDVIDGGAGSDVLTGGDGSDLLQGGEGDDTYIVHLGDKMDLIVDSGGTDTISFADDILQESIAARESPGLLLVQIEQDQQWTYLMVEARDGLVIERFELPDGAVVTGEELLVRVSNEVLEIEAFMEQVVEDATVPVTDGDLDRELRIAVTDSLDNRFSQGLCIRPASYPQPDQFGKQSGIYRPEEHFAVFYGPPKDDRAVKQREQYRALADAGVMSVETVSSPDGDAGERFELTMDGWAFADRNGCMHYAEFELRRVISYFPTGQKIGDAEVHKVKAEIGAAYVQLWAKEPAVLQAFPEIDEHIDGKIVDTVILKAADGWTGSTARGYPITRRERGVATIPGDKELLSVPHIDGLGTLRSRDLCVRLPMLAYGQYDQPNFPYVTSVPVPYRGGAVERINETRQYLDLLLRLGVVTSGHGTRTAPATGKTFRVFEYRYSPHVRLADGRSEGAKCMPVASLEFDLIHARRQNDRVMIRGVQKATPAYPWVTDPAFLAAHPEIVAVLKQPQAALAEIRIADDGSLKMNYWTVPN